MSPKPDWQTQLDELADPPPQTMVHMAAMYGINIYTIRKYYADRGWIRDDKRFTLSKFARVSPMGSPTVEAIIKARMQNPNLTLQEIAKIAGTTRQNVSAALKRYRLPTRAAKATPKKGTEQ